MKQSGGCIWVQGSARDDHEDLLSQYTEKESARRPLPSDRSLRGTEAVLLVEDDTFRTLVRAILSALAITSSSNQRW